MSKVRHIVWPNRLTMETEDPAWNGYCMIPATQRTYQPFNTKVLGEVLHTNSKHNHFTYELQYERIYLKQLSFHSIQKVTKG